MRRRRLRALTSGVRHVALSERGYFTAENPGEDPRDHAQEDAGGGEGETRALKCEEKQWVSRCSTRGEFQGMLKIRARKVVSICSTRREPQGLIETTLNKH